MKTGRAIEAIYKKTCTLSQLAAAIQELAVLQAVPTEMNTHQEGAPKAAILEVEEDDILYQCRP